MFTNYFLITSFALLGLATSVLLGQCLQIYGFEWRQLVLVAFIVLQYLCGICVLRR